MAGGSFGPTGVAKERAEQYQGKVTSYVIIACLVAAIGGSIFGYDIGVSGSSFLPLLNPILYLNLIKQWLKKWVFVCRRSYVDG